MNKSPRHIIMNILMILILFFTLSMSVQGVTDFLTTDSNWNVSASTSNQGVNITIGSKPLFLAYINVGINVTATKITIINNTGGTIGTYTIGTDKRVSPFINLTNNTQYKITAGSEGASFTRAYKFGTYPISASKYNFTSQDDGGTNYYYNILSLTTYDVENSILEIIAKNGTNTLTSFSVNITDINNLSNYVGSTTTGVYIFNTSLNHNYSIFMDATGFAYQTLNKSISTSYEAIQFNLTETNSIFITIRQENNSNLILNSSHTLIGNLGSIYTKSTTNGYVNWTNLPADTYKDSIVSAGYSTKEYSFIIADRTTQNLTAYLNTGTALLLTTKTGIGAIISGALIEMSTFVNGTLQIVESKYTDIQGQAQFATMNNTFYSFAITKTGYVDTYFSLNPVLFSSYEIILSSTEAGISYPDYDVTGTATFNNVTRILTFSYVSTNSSYLSYSWKAEVTTKPQYLLICSNTSTALTNTFTCNLTGYTGNIHVEGIVDGFSFYGGFLDIGMTDNIFDSLDQKDAAFYAGFAVLIIVIGGISFGIFGAIVSSIIALIAIYWLGILTPITLTFIIVAIVISIIIALGIRRQ